jgi:hypothetical protein
MYITVSKVHGYMFRLLGDKNTYFFYVVLLTDLINNIKTEQDASIENYKRVNVFILGWSSQMRSLRF